MNGGEVQDWMLRAPDGRIPPAVEAWLTTVTGAPHGMLPTPPPDLPPFPLLQGLAAQGFLLHGSPVGALHRLVPKAKDYAQPDAFSNRRGVYASSDALWAMMYALRGPRSVGQMDMCLRLQTEHGWSEFFYYYALGTDERPVPPAVDPMFDGWVYVLQRNGFEPSPTYVHGSIGVVQEPHWVRTEAATPVLQVPVAKMEFPLPVAVFNKADVDARAAQDPWGFPWTEGGQGASFA